MSTAILAGGCFWCIEGVMQRLKGVSGVRSGYIGGQTPAPDYQSVCRGETGHAEAVEVTFDESILPFETLLEVFFAVHDPTTLNRQGNDIGTQYRSAIFYLDAQQKATSEAVIARLEPALSSPIVTQLVAATTFHPAEDYHQNYYNQHPDQPYCALVAAPKIAKLKRYFDDLVDPSRG
ncbi:peptide-methionine (S)-S-oxide reductase MsrA [Chitinibacteraceae bacterium HSL-7]